MTQFLRNGSVVAPELTEIEARVLGCLIEKGFTTPEYYPLSRNALTNACNQKSNRTPVVSYDEITVDQALDSLREKKLVCVMHGSGSRVLKYQHDCEEQFSFGRPELAILAELMLRGPQTPGELRSRADRMNRFNDLAEVEAVIEKLSGGESPWMMKLARQPGQKESRYTHLLCTPPADEESGAEAESQPGIRQMGSTGEQEAKEGLEARLEALRNDLDALKREFEAFKSQF